MKITLFEVRQILRRLLEGLGTTCIKCGYDNPFMDPVENYVCRQCRVRDEKFGTGSPFSAKGDVDNDGKVAGEEDILGNMLKGGEPWFCDSCKEQNIPSEQLSCPICGHDRYEDEEDWDDEDGYDFDAAGRAHYGDEEWERMEKEKEQFSGDEWECSRCGQRNHPYAHQCMRCGLS